MITTLITPPTNIVIQIDMTQDEAKQIRAWVQNAAQYVPSDSEACETVNDFCEQLFNRLKIEK